MPKQLRQYLESLGLRSEATDAEAWRYLYQLEDDTQRAEAARLLAPGQQRSQPQPEPEPAPQPADEPSATTVARAERERITTIRGLAPEGIDDAIVERAVNEEWSIERAAREFLQAERQQRQAPADPQGAPAVHVRGRPTLAALAAALSMRTGGDAGRTAQHFVTNSSLVDPSQRRFVADPEERRREAERIADQGSELTSWSLCDMARMSLEAGGHTVPHNRFDMVRAAVSIGGLANVMSPALNARMMQAFEQAPDTTRAFTRESDVPDFRTNERHSLSKMSVPSKRLRGAASEHGSLVDRAPESYKVNEYGQVDFIDRQDIIDDRLDVFQDWPVQMGQAFARLRPDLVYYILLSNPNMADSTALFHADHNNTDANAFSAANLETGVEKMAKQTLNSVTLNLNPSVLIVPQALRFSAQRELESAERRGASGDTGTVNVLQDLSLTLVADGRIDNGVTDPDSGTAQAGSSTAWFLSASPTQAPTIEVGFVAGLGRAPQMTTRTLNGEGGHYGIEWSMSHAVAAKALDYLALYRGNS